MNNKIEENSMLFASGDGTVVNPFVILDADGLKGISDNLSAHYKLGADIDLGGEEFTPVGTSSEAFRGTFDGGGHTVSGLKVSSSGYAGLFGCASGAIFCNLRIEGAEIESTGSYAGILAGCMEGGKAEKCSVSGSVKGASNAGGLAGQAFSNAEVSESRMEGRVEGTEYVGGLTGYLSGRIIDSYAHGNVSSTKGSFNTGGLVGRIQSGMIRNSYAAAGVSSSGQGLCYKYGGVIEDSYYDVQRAGKEKGNSGNQGKLTSAFTCRGFFKAWDFENVWEIVEGESYPYLKWEGEAGKRKAEPGEIYGGDGTGENPYQIRTPGGFQCIPYELSGSYQMTGDIDLEGEQFTPVGTSSGTAFTGTFDGGGHAVRNLKVSAGSYAGLFGYASGATFRNLRIEDAQIEAASNYAGILAGYLNNGTILGCYVSGAVTGNSYAGGLTGWLTGSIIDCYIKGSVTSSSNSIYTGGITGYSQSATIKNSYASAQISGNGQGLAYVYSSTTIQNSFFDSDIAEKTSPAEQARTTEQMFIKDTYAGWDMERIWEYQEGAYPILQKIEFYKNQFFELQVYNRTWHSAIVRWAEISNVAEYEMYFEGEMRRFTEPEIFIEDLFPDTDYELKVIAKLDDTTYVVSRTLKLKTRKISAIKGLHCMGKGENSITLTWEQIADARSYEVVCNEKIILTDTNTCTLTELSADVPYAIYVRALLEDGGELISSPIVEKVYELIPQTDYANEFIAKCEGQRWFIDEVENLLNRKGKSICTVNSRNDFATIYELNLSGRGVSGQVPPAIGELFQLRYLYLQENDLGGQIPKEIASLTYLIDQDLSGNQFTE